MTAILTVAILPWWLASAIGFALTAATAWACAGAR